MAEFASWSGKITFFVNGLRKEITNPDPRVNVLEYLRKEGLTGTKLGCGEGGCGACTVMLSSFDHRSKKINHIAVNACLAPLCALDGVAVTTVEGIGGMRQGLHPVQQRIASMHGSQCGFCTPGIVMSLYAKLRSNPDATPHEIEESLDGNLCRCTGYRPILDAAKSLSNNKSGCCGGGGGAAGGGCPCKEGGVSAPGSKQTFSTEQRVSESKSLAEESEVLGTTEPIFPPFLMTYVPPALRLVNQTYSWFQPTTMAELVQLKASFANAKLVVGNTEVGIETRFKALEYSVFINPSYVAELKQLNMGKSAVDGLDGISVGAAATINQIRDYITEISKNTSLKLFQLRGLEAIKHMIVWFASNQIRNTACIGGNIVTASPISDLNPMLMALDATLKLTSAKGARYVPIRKFFLGYRKVDIQPDEILESVFIPFSTEFDFTVPLKQARRREDDISIVTSGMRFVLKVESGAWIIDSASLTFGGMAATTIMAPKTESFLKGKPWNRTVFDESFKVMQQELRLPEGVPGGQAEYRTALCVSFLFRSFLTVTNELGKHLVESPTAGAPALPIIDARDRSAAENFVTSPKPESRGEQSFYTRQGGIQTARPVPHAPAEDQEKTGPVGESLMHKSARAQVSGEAKYTGDIPLPSTALHAALVMSQRAHARILSVDISKAEACEGFVAYFDHKNITGNNHIGAVIKDEEVFVSYPQEVAKHYGAVIGVIVAKTHEQAIYAVRKVNIAYEDLPAIVSIDEAIAAGSFYPDTHEIKSGNLETGEKSSDFVVEGSIKIGGQEHFYLETNCTVAIPVENGHMEIHSSTQNPTKTQNFCASVLGIPAATVTAHCKRMGGGFGGKETRSVFIACAAAQAALLLNKTVSINIERDTDMSITGQRHAFQVNYKAGCTRDGKFTFLDAHLFSNAGYSLDLSQAVMDRALFHSDNAYKWPAIRVKGSLCRTNQPSHTAFRGFGGPQGMMVSETVIEHLANVSRIQADTLRSSNFYQDGDSTHFGQKIEGYYVARLWKEVNDTANIAERKASIEVFNRENKWKKRGMNILPTKFGINFTAKFMNQGGALVHIYQDGTVLISHGGTEMGQGLHTKMIQVAAQSFGIPDAMINIAETATNVVANASPTAASMSTDLYGMAVLDACEQINERLLPVRAGLPADASWKTVVTTAFFSRVDLSAHGYYAMHTDRCGYDWTMTLADDESNSKRGHPFNYFTQGVVASEVEIDCLTGDSKTIRVDLLMDLGKSINPAIDIGQIEGAFIQGYGWSTMEELIWGDGDHKWVRPGQLFTRGPGFYKIPSFNDAPLDFRMHLADTENKFAVHSSKAVGEPPFFMGASPYFAIINAVNAARTENGSAGYYPLNLPASTERIRMACNDELSSLCTGNNPSYSPKGSW